MAGRLKRIVDYVRSEVVLESLAVARMSLIMDMNVESFTESTDDDPVLEQKLREAAKHVLKVDHLDID